MKTTYYPLAAYFFCCIIAIFAVASGLYLLALVTILLAGMLYLFVSEAERAEQRMREAIAEVRREKDVEINALYEHYDKALLALERLIAAVDADKNPHGVSLINAAGEARKLYKKVIA